MFWNNKEAAVYLYTGILDMRVGIDRLSQLIKEQCNRSIISGGWYVFFSRMRERVRIIYWDRDGYALWTKRLEAGSFKVEKGLNGYEEIAAVDLEEILNGVEFSRIKLRKQAEKGLFS